MKLFFKRAPEMRGMLGAALSARGCRRQPRRPRQSRDVRAIAATRPRSRGARGGMRERGGVTLLRTAHATTERFAEQIFDEFNTLSVLYRKPAYLFHGRRAVDGAADALRARRARCRGGRRRRGATGG